MLRVRRSQTQSSSVSQARGKRGGECVDEVTTHPRAYTKTSSPSLAKSRVRESTRSATSSVKTHDDEGADECICPLPQEICEQAKSRVASTDPNEREDRWWLQVGIGEYKVRALYDSGASRTVLNALGLQIASACGVKITPGQGKTARVADGSRQEVVGYADLPFDVAGIRKIVRVAIVPAMTCAVYLGTNFCRVFDAIADPKQDLLYLREQQTIVPLEVAALETRDEHEIAAVGLARVTAREREQIEQLIERLLPAGLPAVGCTSLIEHEIDVGAARPVKQRFYPVSKKIEEEMRSQVQQMLKEDIIEPSMSGWSSPVVMVRKANGKYRFCVDFRKVNALSKADAYPLPYMDDILRKLQKAKYITTLDLSSAYHQIPLKRESREITAFTVPGLGLYQFKRMPYGLSYAGATFQRMIDKIISPDLEPFAFSYLDDIIIVTESYEEHLKYLEVILRRLRKAGLTINKEKSVFVREEVKYLGVLVNHDGSRPDPEKIAPILEYPAPRNLKQLRRFMGMASWYRKFLPNFASIVEPLTRLTKKDRKYAWLDEQQSAFEKAKALIASAPVLQRPHYDAQFVVQTDASDSGLGAVLYQLIDGQEGVLEFASRTMSQAERNYSVTERECLAVIWAVRKFRPYIEGYEFKVVTDHSSLRWLSNLKNPTGRLARWALELQGHTYSVEHRKGAHNYVPDALSRMYETDAMEICAVDWASNTQDDWYLSWLDKVGKSPTDHPRYKIVGGQLYKYCPNTALQETLGDDDAWKIAVPIEKRQEILHECHDEPMSGHFGREKTYARVSLYYFWPRMYRDVEDYVRKCSVCQQCKVEQRAPAGFMGRRVIEKPWSTVAGDIMGPLPRTSHGNEYILILQDLFSRWIECVPIRRANGRTILRELKERVIMRYGAPEVFLSDNGTEFKNKLIDEYLSEQNICHMTTPPYHPQANPVERVNRTIKTAIRAFVEERHNTWDEKLPEIVFAYNTAVHSSTGTSPALLNFGRQPKPTGSARCEQDAAAAEQQQREAIESWTNKMQELEGLRARAAEQARGEQERQARYYDARRREADYVVGDRVWKKNHVLSSATEGIAAKLAPRFAGPYVITAKLGANTYRLLNAQGGVVDLVHASQLKRYVGDESSPTIPQQDEEDAQRDPQPPRDASVRASESAPMANNERAAACEQRDSEQTVACAQPSEIKRARGRPRKTVTICVKPHIIPQTSIAKSSLPKRRPGRPKGSRKQTAPVCVLSPRRTRATRR